MDRLMVPPGAEVIDQYARAFESDRARQGPVDLGRYLPAPGHPLYRAVVRELVRIDLEFGWSEGRPRPLDDYRARYPEVFRDPAAFQDIAFEEYRQRLERGEPTDPAEYARRYGVDPSEWPAPGRNREPAPAQAGTVVVDSEQVVAAALHAYKQFAAAPAAAGDDSLPSTRVAGSDQDALDVFREVHRSDPDAARRLAEPVSVPAAGADFLGFHLVEELGRGAFGRVFLARQMDLADRAVALKIALDLYGETQTLARLQHTNIVPVYSVHRAGPLQAICMPYFGATTLADVVRGLGGAPGLPDSGKHLVSTLNGRKSRTRECASTKLAPGGCQALPEPPASSAERAAPPATKTNLMKFEGLTYVEAVLWLTGRLADGLAHAHDRGIVHRDLKPANVLLTDEGEPMLLDFNLSDDTRVRDNPSAARMGGTLPYMSPEQLAAFGQRAGGIDGSSDLYSLGMIVFELLTGQPPFPHRTGTVYECLEQMRADRAGPAPRLRAHNPAVSPAAEAIVRKCLDPDPARRYQSAAELREDLERQLTHRPLRYAPDPSVRERARKWVRRHPRLTSSTSVAAIAAVLLLALTGTGWAAWREYRADLEASQREQTRLTALDSAGRLRQGRQVQLALTNYPDRATVAEVIRLSQDALRGYPVVDDPAWEESALVRPLLPDEKATLRKSLTDILATWADAEREWAAAEPDPAARREHLTLAFALTERAEAVGGDGGRALIEQRARVAGLIGSDVAADLARRAAAMAPRTANDHFALARDLLRKHEIKKAVPHLAEATRLDPRHFWAWFFLGNCRYELLQYDEAVACYSACIGLIPDPSVAYFPYFHRAVAYAARGSIDEADADLNRAAAALADLPDTLLRKERAKPYVEQARLRARRKDYAAAEEALKPALAADAPDPRALFERAKVRRLRGDKDGAAQDLEAGLKHRPADEGAWVDRGLARLETDPKGALADFDEALKLNPDSYAALQNQAHVLSERLGREAEAMAALDRIVHLYPGYVRARIGRAVILARQGKRTEAHADVRESLARDRSAVTLYQAANVFALTSRQTPADAERVVPLLAAALWAGFGLDLVDRDSDMDPVRDRPDFKRVIQVVRELTSR
jgi:eukaryotic-like serine/threonine-protein kinase